MTKEEYTGVLDAQLALSRLGSLMRLISESTDDGNLVDSIDLCADYAKASAERLDQIPGFREAKLRRD